MNRRARGGEELRRDGWWVSGEVGTLLSFPFLRGRSPQVALLSVFVLCSPRPRLLQRPVDKVLKERREADSGDRREGLQGDSRDGKKRPEEK